MSLYSALFSGVSGLQSQSTAMAAISDNISNVNTNGYKGTNVQFSTMVTAQASTSSYAAGGVMARPKATITMQGMLQQSTSTTDLSISGGGMFITSSTPNTQTNSLYTYTRAGSFNIDSSGFLANTAGGYMLGWPLQAGSGALNASVIDVNGSPYTRSYTNGDGVNVYINPNVIDPVNMRPMNINDLGGTAAPTSTLSMGLNLPSNEVVGRSHNSQAVMFDSLGNQHNLNYVWTKTDTSNWGMNIVPPRGAASIVQETPLGEIYFSAGRLDFVDKPAAGSQVVIGGITFSFVDSAGAGVTPPQIEIGGGLTLNQIVDTFAQALNTHFTTAHGKSAPYGQPWAHMVQGQNSIIIKTGSQTAGGDVAVETKDLIGQNGAPAVMQFNDPTTGGNDPSSSFVITAANPAKGWIDTITAPGTYGFRSAIKFNGDGSPRAFFGETPATVGNPKTNLKINFANGSLDLNGGTLNEGADSAILQNWGNYNESDGITQQSGEFQIYYTKQDGARFGNFSGMSVNKAGVVTASFDNGIVRPIFQVPVAEFINPDGLGALTGNQWMETTNSGQPTIRAPGDGGAGIITSNSLELSNVDLSTEFTRMITTQRAYSASSKIITTADEMLDELVRIKR